MKKRTASRRCPQILYKFTKFETFFDKAELRISPICELNDPFEGMPVIEHIWKEDDFLKDYENKLAKIKNQSFIKEYDLERIHEEAKKNPKYVYKILKDAVAKSNIPSLIYNLFINDNISVLSLTSCNNNELMWSFYADAYKGFAIGLKSNHHIFHNSFWNDKNLNVELKKVTYEKQRRRFYLEVDDGFCIDTLLYKSKSWKYEREWRLIISNTKKLHDNDKGINGFLCIPDDAISEIILGHKVENHIKEKAEHFCKSHNILLRKAIINKTQYKIDIIDL